MTVLLRGCGLLVWLLVWLLVAALPLASRSQEATSPEAGVVKIVSANQKGSGFIVRLGANEAYIVTAAHVVENDKNPGVAFFNQKYKLVPATVVRLEGGDDPRGLALLRVEAPLPSGLVALPLAPDVRVRTRDEVEVIGIPRAIDAWSVFRRWVASRIGREIVFADHIAEGFSGGPALKDGKVVGLVTRTGNEGRALVARSVQTFLEGVLPLEFVPPPVVAAPAVPVTPDLSPAQIEAKLASTPDQWREIQTALNTLGLNAGAPDGVPGRQTRSAVEGFQRSRGYEQTGYLTGEQRQRLEEEVKAAVKPEMVKITGGCFQMGSPANEEGRFGNEKLHEVCVEDFMIGKYEVTVGEFRRFVASMSYRTEVERKGGCYGWTGSEWKQNEKLNWRNPGFEQGDDRPVVCVSWNDAVAYGKWLSAQTDEPYRLPTEAEWEYAARAGTQTARFWGDDANVGCKYANGADQTAGKKFSGWTVMGCEDGYVYTSPVGRYRPNDYGLYDVLGNAWEWTCSEYDADYGGAEETCISNNRADGRRGLRGGSWFYRPARVRSAFRSHNTPGTRDGDIGFRLAQDL